MQSVYQNRRSPQKNHKQASQEKKSFESDGYGYIQRDRAILLGLKNFFSFFHNETGWFKTDQFHDKEKICN